MNRDDEIKDLLIEIRDNQKLSLQRQEEHLEIARQQVDRANRQVTESIELQKLALTKAKQVARIAIPGIILCIALIIYLVVVYF
jgi:hypothetical protein